MERIKTRDVIAYATLPRIIPRLKKFFFSGFGFLTLLIAYVYALVRLLPQGHPYLDPKNMGRYGIRHVVIEASKNLTYSRNNIDQIIVFFAILGGIILLFLQFALLFYTLVSGYAHAFSWFDTADPATDVAYTLLDRVFGVPNVFCSIYTPANCTDYSGDTNLDGAAGPVIPLPFHTALQALFRFYSQGLLLIAMLIFLYFVVVIILETAVTGTPFGQRFQNVWVPIRLVVALGLLVPINYGFNSGQWITLYIAKYGSSFATNGWNSYNTAIGAHAHFTGVPIGPDEVAGNPLGHRYNLLAIPQPPDMMPLISTMAIVHTCAYLYHRKAIHPPVGATPGYNRTNPLEGGLVPEDATNLANWGYTAENGFATQRVRPWLVKSPTPAMISSDGVTLTAGVVANDDERVGFNFSSGAPYYGRSYLQALGFYYGGDIIIRFGEFAVEANGSTPKYSDTGNVKPLCGDVRIPISSLEDANGFSATPPRGGASHMQDFYYRMVLDMWYGHATATTGVPLQQFARVMATVHGSNDWGTTANLCNPANAILSGTGTPGFAATQTACEIRGVDTEWKIVQAAYYAAEVLTAIRVAWRNHVQAGYGSNMTGTILDLGWGGAGVWFTKVANLNGRFIESVNSVPSMDQYPLIMEEVRATRAKMSQTVDSSGNQFSPTFVSDSDTKLIELKEEYAKEFSVPLAHVYDYFRQVKDLSSQKPSVGNIMTDVMNMLLGTSGLMSIRNSNRHIHPLAQLVAVGKSLVETAIRNVAIASASAFMGGMLGVMEEAAGKSLGAGVFTVTSGVLVGTAFMGLTCGFILYYVLPLLPFVYFYFAVGGWIKTIFEAMVGVPLWALAHLRIDGDGLPGDAAQNGYFLLLEIFIRPILTLFGLIAAITIFSTQVYTLNMIWDLVTMNATGFEPGTDILVMSDTFDVQFRRGTIDKFFFTIIYTIICYMLALASFKLIDQIPDNILRWAGAGVSSFGDIDKDNVEALSRYASMGSMTIGGRAVEAARETSAGVGSGIGKALAEAVAKKKE